MKKKAHYLFILAISMFLMQCGEQSEEQSLTSNGDEIVDEGEYLESEAKVEMNYETENPPVKVYTYTPPTSTIIDSTHLFGHVGDLAIEVALYFHEDNALSGNYVYTKYNKPIEIYGTLTIEHCEDSIIRLQEWASATEMTGEWLLYTQNQSEWQGDWYHDNEPYSSMHLRLQEFGTDFFLPAQTYLHFKTEEKANQFFTTHHFHNNTTMDRHMLIVPNDNSKYALLPEGLTLYEISWFPGECSTDFDLIKKGGVEQGQYIYLLESDKEVNIYNDFEILHSTPVGDFEAIRATGLRRSRNGELVVTLEGEDYFNIKVSELEDLGYHLEGDVYYYMNTISNGLDCSTAFNEVNPLTVFSEPNKHSEQLMTFSDASGPYFVVTDAVIRNQKTWLKVKVMEEGESEYHHSKNDGVILLEGWIPLYGEDNYELSLTFYGNGC